MVQLKDLVSPNQSSSSSSTSNSILQGFSTGFIIFVVIFLFLIPGIGAAKLSYDKYQSLGWAIVCFIFPGFYYVFYAFFISSRSVPMMGGRRR